MADAKYTRAPSDSQGHITVSSMFRDPALAAIFRRGEEGDSLAIAVPIKPVSPQGAFVGELA